MKILQNSTLINLLALTVFIQLSTIEGVCICLSRATVTDLSTILYATGTLPMDWKTANIVPVYKKGSRCDKEISADCVKSVKSIVVVSGEDRVALESWALE